MTVRVLVAEGHDLIRAGLVASLRAAAGFEVAGDAADGVRAVALAAETEPDVVLMDLRLPVLDGLGALRRIFAAAGARRPHVLMFAAPDADEAVHQALAEGASGVLVKETPPARILAAIGTAVAGDVVLSPALARRLGTVHRRHQQAARSPALHVDRLTAREVEVLGLLGGGLSNEEIAGRLVLSESTVKTHVKRLMAKLTLASRAQAVVVAYESGLVVPGHRRPRR